MGHSNADLLPRAPRNPVSPDDGRRAHHVVFTFDDVTWDAAQRRGMCFSQDRLALALLGDRRVERLLVCNRPRSAPVKLIKDLVRRPVAFDQSDRARLRQPLRIRQHDPVRVESLKRVYATYGQRLRRAAERFGMDRPAVITSSPFVAGFADLDWAGPVTLFATDDLSAHPDYRRWRTGLEAAYAEVSRRERRVCAVTSAIIERVAPRGPALVVPNAVDPDEWLRPGSPPDWFGALPGPRLLYLGALDARLDAEAIRDVARAWPQASVVLVGPSADREHLAAALAEPNVVLRGPVARGDVAALVHAADVCLMPHQKTELTESMSPLKLYEYLAGGGPAVATDLEPVRRVEGPIVRVAPRGDFVAGVRAALEVGPATEEERRRFIESNSWSRRCAEILAVALAD